MNHEEFGTADIYYEAFRVIQAEGIPENHVALLRAHFNAQGHTVTWAQLAKLVGYANRNAVQLQYGRLARRVAQLLGIEEPPKGFWLFTLVGWAKERDAVSGHTAFELRRPVIEALTRLSILRGATIELLPDEVDAGGPIREGAPYPVLVNAYERDPVARRKCIEAHGSSCCICAFDFGAVYGEVAEGYIHVHHLRPLSEIREEYVVDPVEDLRPVCPNCHAVLHRRIPAHSIEEVKAFLTERQAPKPRQHLLGLPPGYKFDPNAKPTLDDLGGILVSFGDDNP